MNVASVLSECCIYMHVASICFKCFIRMFASVSSGCCICLQWFSNVFQVFSQVFQTFVSSVSSMFFCTLQLLHLEVSKVDRVLYMGSAWEADGSADDVRAAWQRSGRRGPTVGALAREHDTLAVRLLPVRAASRH